MPYRKLTGREAREVIEKGTEDITDHDIEHVLEKEREIRKKFHGPLGKFVTDGKTLISLVKDYWYKNYRQVPWWTIAAASTALLYVLNPMDIVPDFLPFVGLVDDATVVSVCIFMLDRELAHYREWKEGEGARTAVPDQG